MSVGKRAPHQLKQRLRSGRAALYPPGLPP